MEKGKSNVDSKTKQYEINGKRKNKRYREESKKENQNKKKKRKKHSKLKKFILIVFIIILLAILAAVGVFAGIFFGDTWAITEQDLIANGNTEIFASDGSMIDILNPEEGGANRKIITLDQMGRFTANAYIAIEDKRFYEHSGVDILRTAKATISYLLNRGSDSDVGGGSTITQQLVKNMKKDSDNSGLAGIKRKIREMSRAYKIEQMLTKDQILEKYLNIIYMGATIGDNDIQGIEYGAIYYFAKSAKDLDLAESAFFAGINHAPSMYNPYIGNSDGQKDEMIKNRTKLVLNFMKEQNRISDDPEEAQKLYDEAIAKVDKGLPFKRGKIDIGSLSYFVNEAVSDAARDLAEAKDVDFDEAYNMILSGGYKLYTTQVPSIQSAVIKEMAKSTYVEKRSAKEKDENGKTKTVTYRTNAGMTIIEPSTGKVVAMGGDLQQDNAKLSWNYATSTRQTGSSIKPLANIAPGLEEKVITASTVYYDEKTNFKELTTEMKNVGSYYGLCTVRKAVERSSNIVNIKIMSDIGVNKCIDYLHEFGLTTYVKGEDGLTLAIGGATHGSSTLQMAAAYACLANGGEYIEPTFYTKLVDSNGNTVLEPKQEKRRVISEQNAYIISNILLDVVRYTVASPCAISGMDVAAKTGTTDSSVDKWLCGYTPYYAGAVWYGFGASNKWGVSKTSSAINIWANVMETIHKGLKGKRFERPDDIVTATICRTSGKLATSKCASTYTEYFVKGTVPKECDGHVTVNICKETGKVATEYCPEIEEKQYTDIPEKEKTTKWSPKSGSRANVPTETCDIHTLETSMITVQNVVGLTQEVAMSTLAGLNIQVISEQHSDQADGIVIRQSIAPETRVEKGVTIIITVNSNKTVTNPEVPTPTTAPTSASTPTPTPTQAPTTVPTSTPTPIPTIANQEPVTPPESAT